MKSKLTRVCSLLLHISKFPALIFNKSLPSLVVLGLHFIESHLPSATDEEQPSPVGFDILFPSMIESAKNLDMNLPLGGSTLDALLDRRDFELKRYIFCFLSCFMLVLIC